MKDGCDCAIDNVAIDIGITHTRVGDLLMGLLTPLGDVVTLVNQPPSAANLVSGNKITFDDSDPGAKDPQTLGDDVDMLDNILADTYFAEGLGSGAVDPVNGLGKFNNKNAAGDWTFRVFDLVADNTGTIESVELTITCQ